MLGFNPSTMKTAMNVKFGSWLFLQVARGIGSRETESKSIAAEAHCVGSF